MFADFIPMALTLFDLEPEDRSPFLSGILCALGGIGEAVPASVKEAVPKILEALKELDSQARAMAISLGKLGELDNLLQHPELAHDSGIALICRAEQLAEDSINILFANTLANAGEKADKTWNHRADLYHR